MSTENPELHFPLTDLNQEFGDFEDVGPCPGHLCYIDCPRNFPTPPCPKN